MDKDTTIDDEFKAFNEKLKRDHDEFNADMKKKMKRDSIVFIVVMVIMTACVIATTIASLGCNCN